MNNISSELVKSQQSQLVENVKKWVVLDSQLKLINEKTKTLRNIKHDVSEQICKYMEERNQTKINISDGELRVYEKKEYSPITFGYIEEKLSEIISDKEKVDYIIQYLKENRDIKITSDIRRTNTTKISS